MWSKKMVFMWSNPQTSCKLLKSKVQSKKSTQEALLQRFLQPFLRSNHSLLLWRHSLSPTLSLWWHCTSHNLSMTSSLTQQMILIMTSPPLETSPWAMTSNWSRSTELSSRSLSMLAVSMNCRPSSSFRGCRPTLMILRPCSCDCHLSTI